MQITKIEINGIEYDIPQSDLKWFLENTEAKEIKEVKSKLKEK